MEYLFIVLVIYFLPAMIAYHRKHRNAGAITVLTMFLGWSLIGWVAALIWASTDNTKKDA